MTKKKVSFLGSISGYMASYVQVFILHVAVKGTSCTIRLLVKFKLRARASNKIRLKLLECTRTFVIMSDNYLDKLFLKVIEQFMKKG